MEGPFIFNGSGPLKTVACPYASTAPAVYGRLISHSLLPPPLPLHRRHQS